eukprot:TRINITY_DN14297_c0_g1_i1.p1 TRINITY_DN14297_c0_g1~~TRINITY_DN14297_c0_g1_i1.p1  ORF type:complete len:217 (-),score=3.87 TRINITY_DN14297_c0_g1_i1:247-867(-)
MSVTLRNHLVTMHKYNRWAYGQIEKHCRQHLNSPTKYFQQQPCLVFKDVHNTLSHCWMAEQLWLLRILGSSQTTVGPTANTISLQDMYTYWQPGQKHSELWSAAILNYKEDPVSIFEVCKDSTNKWLQFLQSCKSDSDLVRDFGYQDSSGAQYSANVANIAAHAVNHSTHHRGQVAAALCESCGEGVPAVVLDLPVYTRSEATPGA